MKNFCKFTKCFIFDKIKYQKMQKTTKRDIAKQYVKKYSGKITSKRALAKLIFEENKEAFKSVEDARDVIRGVTYAHGKKAAVNGIDWDLPEGDKNDYKDFIMPLSANKLLVLPDIHFPYHSKEALEMALNDGYKKNCNAILINGDGLDFYKGSKYDQNRTYKDLYEEIEYFKIFLDELKESFDVPIYFKIGNHEERWERMLRENPQIDMFEDFKLKNILQFGKYNVTEIGGKQEIKCGRFSIWHGHEFHGSGGVNPAKWLFERTMRSGVCGHFHRPSEHRVWNGSEWIENYSMGTLGDLRPAFMPHQRASMTWAHGYGILEWNKSEFDFKNVIIK